MSEPKLYLRAVAEQILRDQPSNEDNVRELHGKLLDLAESVWLAGFIAGKNGRMQVENPYSVLCGADRDFVKEMAQLAPIYETVLATPGFAEPLFPAIIYGAKDPAKID